LLLASMGIKIAKHGNKAVSSKCGSGDVLEKLKIKINLEPKKFPEGITPANFEVVKRTLQSSIDFDWTKKRTVEELRKSDK